LPVDSVSAAGAAAITAGVLAGAVTNRVTGLGFSLVCSPVMLLVLGPRDGVRLLNMVSVAVSLSNVSTGLRGVRWRDCALLMAAGVASTPAAAWVAHRVDERVLLVGAGLVTVASAVLLASGRVLPFVRGTRGAFGAGAVSATMNVVAGLSGPSVAMYGLNAGWTPEELRPTLQVYFLVLNLVAVASLGPVRPPAIVALGIVAAVAGALALGAQLARRVPAARFRVVVLTVVAAGGLVAVVRGFAG
jgi:hypothetical protein